MRMLNHESIHLLQLTCSAVNQIANMQSACHTHSAHNVISAHSEYYGYLPVLRLPATTMATCRYHAMSCHVKRDLPRAIKVVFSIFAQVCIYRSCSSLRLYTVHMPQQLVTSLKLITTLCARTECKTFQMRSCCRRTASRPPMNIHRSHMNYNT